MTYRRDAVPENPNDMRRYVDNEYRKLEDETDATEVNLGVVNTLLKGIELVETEEAILQGSTTITVDTLTNYANGWKPQAPILSDEPQTIVYDEVAGTITVGRAGIYEISGYVVQGSGSNGQAYTWAIDHDSVKFVLGTVVWEQAMSDSDQAFFAAVKIAADVGDVFKITTTNATGTVITSSLGVKLETLDSFS